MKGKEREGIVLTGVLSVLLLAWLGFFFHRSPRFPGSGLGAAFGIAAALLMLVPLVYSAAKRIPWVRGWMTPYLGMKTLLDLHVYAGLLGALLAIIHTGHRFDSWLGIALTALMLLVIVSGFAVRYLLAYVALEIKEKKVLLQTARGDLDHAWGVREASSTATSAMPQAPALAAGLTSLGLAARQDGAAGEVMRIAESVADLEYSVRLHEFFKVWFGRSLKWHIALSIGFYVVLAMHIGAGVQYGLRWLS
ncbi:hypothetical protein [Piscinibacter koreensis]|uniref:Iron reductase n=1 Tax=Piscinibacter koreensis TaxID=2742824 RepID=A0A7Y6NSH1_9BURK|nr:hypothetical protein [Schlegelella koreensis]NUZ08513.1 hypothetical protein [Schlegelella koreensis]